MTASSQSLHPAGRPLAAPGDPASPPQGSVVITVPAATHPGTGSLLRLGRPSAEDEGPLPLDPTHPPTVRTGAEPPNGESPFPDGLLAYSTGTVQLLGPHGYLRIGSHTRYEHWFPTTPDPGLRTQPAGSGPVWAREHGMLLYSPHTISIAADTASTSAVRTDTYTSDTVRMLGDRSGVAALSGSVNESGSTADVALIRGNAYAAQIGAVTSILTGNGIQNYLGNIASIGVGGRLVANIGATQHINAGQIVSIANSNISVEGWRATKIGQAVRVAAVEQLTLACAPLGATAMGIAAGVIAKTAALAAIAGVLAPVAVEIALDVQADVASDDELRTGLKHARLEIALVEGLTVLVQVLTIIAGVLMKKAADAAALAATSRIVMTPVGVTIASGPNSLEVTDDGIVLYAPAGAIAISGSAIELSSSTTIPIYAPSVELPPAPPPVPPDVVEDEALADQLPGPPADSPAAQPLPESPADSPASSVDPWGGEPPLNQQVSLSSPNAAST